MSDQYAAALASFIAQPSADTVFHAWIALDGHDLLDVVAPSFAPAGSVTQGRRFVDQESATEDCILYTGIIYDPVKVTQFYHKLKSLRLGK